jgi:hypothetical protein
MLFRGGPFHEPPNYHCAPVPVLSHDGRLYRAFQDNDPLNWPKGFQALVISAQEDTDLLEASNWTMTNKLPLAPEWIPQDWGHVEVCGWEEGNVVLAPDGRLFDIMRINGRRSGGRWWEVETSPDCTVWNRSAWIELSGDGKSLSFDSKTGFREMPGGHSKFVIRFDAESGNYYTLCNAVRDEEHPTLRSILSLYRSADLREWEHRTDLLTDTSGLEGILSVLLTGFQYVDWQFDGDDILCAVRTAFRGAHTFHDSNRILFGRIPDFRGA